MITTFRFCARSLTPVSVIASLLSSCLLSTGCVASKYRRASEDTPPPQVLNVSFTTVPLGAILNTVITYNGPGSWKRNAFWDEYVVSLHNSGTQTFTVTSVGLQDFSGTERLPGDKPWALEKESKTLEQKYKEAGIGFVRYTAPGLILGTAGVGFAGASLMSAGAAGAATVCILALPVYYGTVLTINHYNKVAMQKEFDQRRIVLPLVLAPGESRVGSFFFPMVPSPRSLTLHWTDGAGAHDTILTLDFLHRLHLKETGEGGKL